jgi:hypothetical protein
MGSYLMDRVPVLEDENILEVDLMTIPRYVTLLNCTHKNG